MSGYTAGYARMRIEFNRRGQSIEVDYDNEYARDDANTIGKPTVDQSSNRGSEINHISVKGKSSARDAR